MIRIAAAMLFAALLGACATPPQHNVPVAYAGPVAVLDDSMKRLDSSEADLFYVTHINGRAIADSRGATHDRNYGRGLSMTPVILTRSVLAQDSVFRIVGRTEHAAPILALTNPVYEVKGDVRFTPEADKQYVVRGRLSSSYSAVWIEEAATGAVMGNKVEVNGSARLGIFQK